MAWIFYEETIYTFRRPQPRESLWAKVKPYLVGAMLGVTFFAILYALAVVHFGPNGSPRPVPPPPRRRRRSTGSTPSSPMSAPAGRLRPPASAKTCDNWPRRAMPEPCASSWTASTPSSAFSGKPGRLNAASSASSPADRTQGFSPKGSVNVKETVMSSLYYEETLTTYSRPQSKRASRSWLRLYLVLAGLVVAAAGGIWLYGWVCSMQQPRDPRPEVQRYVDDVTKNRRTDIKALNAYRKTLPPHERASLHHDINYLLQCRGIVLTGVEIGPEGSPEAGQLVEVLAVYEMSFWEDRILSDLRAGRKVDTESVSIALYFTTKRDTEPVRDFMDNLKAKLRPFGKTASWDGNEFRIISR